MAVGSDGWRGSRFWDGIFWNRRRGGTLSETLTGVPEIVASAEDATSGSCGDNLTWILEDGLLTISGTGEMEDYSSMNGMSWYSSKSSIETVVIEDGVISIGERAFNYCYSLTDVTISESVTSIGKAAFAVCKSLPSVVIPDSVTSIGSNAFYECKSLTSIIFFNPNCKIPDSSLTIWNEDYLYTGTIYNYDNSTAEAYAETYGYIFISLGTPLSLADLDGDNEITVQDAYLYQCAFANAAAGNGDGLTDTQRIAADVDGDGEITVQDAYYIQKYYAQTAAGNYPTWDDILS